MWPFVIKLSESQPVIRELKESKMRSIGILMVLAAVLLMGAPDAHAGLKGKTVNLRQHKQEHRIRQGVKSGELTRREASTLVKKEHILNRKERQFRSDGHLTNKEWLKLQAGQDRLSRQIYTQKHDRQNRD